MSDWEAVVGLEIHVHLKTRTKMFCRCETGFGAPENTHTCPVCLAHPGALPVANRTAVEWTIKLGLALGSEIAERAVFARKNYFYPDNPKGYQISQYDLPLCVGGRLAVPGEPGFEIGFVRAHLEEDAAKTVHVGGGTGRKVGAERSLIDFNRGGTPLVEIVTRPDIRSAEQAERFLQLLRQTIVALGISDARMEEGTLRCDANVSVRPAGSEELRTRWELKNMNSFRFIGRGIDAAVRQQIAIYEGGGKVEQHTYDYEPDTDTLTPHRSKEEADDYRYFPEPDLVPLEPEAALVERLRAELPELPADAIRARTEALGVADDPGRRQPRGAGEDPEGVQGADARGPVERGRGQCRRRLQRRGVPRADCGLGLGRAAADRGGDPRRQPRAGRGLPRGQGRAARLLRRPGDEGDGREGEPEGRERAPA
jgi:aspartyl-tRNA(Asn)/glutamyl-tRNA(Gln) amidotransferase subunit B